MSTMNGDRNAPIKRDWLISHKVSGAVMGIYDATTAAGAILAMHDDAGAVGAVDADGRALDGLDDWTAREVTDHLARSVPDGELYVCRLDDAGTVDEAAGPLAHGELSDALAGDWDDDPETADWLEGRFVDGAAVLLSRDEESAMVTAR